MVLIAAVLLIASLAALAVGLGIVATPNGEVQRRAQEFAHREEKLPKKRLMQVNRLPRGWVASFTPPSFVDAIERNLVLAGRPAAWTVDKAVTYKPIGLAVGSLFCLVMVLKGGAPALVLVGVLAVPLGYFVPDLLIYNMAVKRQQQIQKELPDLLDQIVISIEAGVGFEQALARAGERNSGPLAEEVMRLVQDMTLGLSRREAYLGLANRTSIDDLKNFCGAVVQAEEYGISIASVVRSQATELRHARRMRAEAEAQKVPVKILVPLMLCVLPVLFIIVLGPAIVSAYAQ
ncbi:type II secretion system F family protein [Aeromicrobium sp. Leaf350]|uniref:type II secretion system F family protein n=1 Tax=Aeromicrobium sp. Leaf350 TaxID=2876565 RepID=UPI001E49AD99|nr:type II secretion system F family protein [Aeromicrobium sp. Leaf350]